jgi:hypothetical protein
MPITTPQGTLDFKKVDRVTFVGASSNTVIDTTTGSLGVGVDGNGPTSKLHVVGNTRLEGDINMLHTSNTASIKLNSNVVAEFPRSKKLIKYPRVNLTQNALNNGYAAEASTENNGTSSGQAYRAFDGLANGERGYHSATVYTSGSTYNGTASITDADGTQHQGEWIKLQMPTTEKMKLSGFSFSPRYVSSAEYHHRTPYKGVFLGSTDGIGTNWYPIHYFDNVAGSELTTVSRTFENTTNDYYNHIALVVYEVGPNATYGDVLNLAEMELFGTPEYDPDAHGTDVTVKSKANVPNTDWLEVYYDAKGLPTAAVTTVNDLKPVGTANNGTVGGNTSVTDEAFTFDGTGDYITSTVTTGSGNQSFSVACWFKFTTLGGLLWGFTGTTDGTSGSNPTNNSTPHAYFNTTGSINFDFWANSTVTAEKLIEANRWYAGVWTYDGTTRKIYIDGTQVHLPQSSTPLSIIDNTSRLSIGIYPTNLSGGPMTGSIANFRLFNRALTSDEIYQLYAYQKEDFGHGDLSMTLKAGRLGIGTSEPRGALDVRGDAYYGCPVFFTAYAGNGSNATSGSSSAASGGTVIIFSNTTVNKGGAYDTSNGRCTFPISGYYEVFFRGGTGNSSSPFHARIYRNGSVPGTGGWTNHVMRVYDNSGGTYRNGGTIHFFYYFTAGEYIDVRMTEGTFNADNYNSFSVKYLSN